MGGNRLSAILARYLAGMKPSRKPVSVEQRARDLITAIDAGGLPLNPFIVNDIARQMGLDVAANAPMAATISRIRQTLK